MALNATMTFEVRTSGADDQGGGFRGAGNLARPSAPGVATATTGGTVAAGTYYVVVVYVGIGDRESECSPATSIVTTGSTSTITVTSPAASPGAAFYRVYIGTVSTGPYFANPGTNVAIGTSSVRTTTPATSGTQAAGVDRSQQNGAYRTYTDLVLASTTTATSAAFPFVPADVGNLVNITSGTGWTTGWYEIVSVTAANVATLDRTPGASGITGGNGKMGGALATLSQAAVLAVNASHNVYIKAGTYNEMVTVAVSNGFQRWIGYNATRGDNPLGSDRPVIDGQATRANCIASTTNAGYLFSNFIFQNATSNNVNTTTGNHRFVDCRSTASGASGFSIIGARFIRCEADNNVTSGYLLAATSSFIGCIARSNGTDGFKHTTSGDLSLINCLAYGNAGRGFYETFTSSTMIMINCTSANNTGANGHGLDIPDVTIYGMTIMNCIFAGNSGYGIIKAANTKPLIASHNDFYNNTLGDVSNLAVASTSLALDPQFVNAAGGNFAIGANLKAAGDGAFPGALTRGYVDVGAAQRQELGGMSRGRVTNQ